MTTFREQVALDFQNVLLNTKEFGRLCSWNGASLQIAEDANLEQLAFDTHGVNVDRKKIVCRVEDLTPAPKVTEQVMFDGEWWQVADVKNPFAHLIITLERRVA